MNKANKKKKEPIFERDVIEADLKEKEMRQEAPMRSWENGYRQSWGPKDPDSVLVPNDYKKNRAALRPKVLRMRKKLKKRMKRYRAKIIKSIKKAPTVSRWDYEGGKVS